MGEVSSLFAQARKAHSPAAAFSFLFALAAEAAGTGAPTLAQASAAYGAACAGASTSWVPSAGVCEAEAAEALAPGFGEGAAALRNMTQFASDKGLPVNSYTLNGLLDEGMDLQQGLLSYVGREQQLLAAMLGDGRLAMGTAEGAKEAKKGDKGKKKGKGGKKSAAADDDATAASAALPPGKTKSVLSVLMSQPSVVGRYHPLVGEQPADLVFLLPPKVMPPPWLLS